jgi:hypothetical protein
MDKSTSEILFPSQREPVTLPTYDDNLEFVEGLAKQALAHRAVHHPYLHELASGTVPDSRWALADFARHYYGYSAHFRRYFATVIIRLEEDQKALLENLTGESGQYSDSELEELSAYGIRPEWFAGVPHPLLFQRFCKALGVEQLDPEQEAIEVVCWREMFLSVLANGSLAEAIGALGLGTEGIVQSIYGYFVRAIARVGDLAPKDTVFFPLHTVVDDQHQATLQQIAAKFCGTAEGRRDLCMGMHKALALRNTFWNWLLERARDPARAGDFQS